MRCLADAFSPRGTHRPVSGSGLSEDERFSYGYSSVCGKRASMEDFYDARISKIDGKVVGMFGVFDGHGGAHAAKYVQRYLFDNLTSHPEFVSNPRLAIQEAYEQTDRNFLKDEEMDDGSTASTAVLVGDRLLVANLGDSRAVLCKAGEALALSTDHKPDRTDERQRIEDAGGCVIHVGTWRVGGVLAVSRAFGDRTLKKYVSAVPEIQEERITDDVDFLVLASDGLWDVVTNEGAVALVQSIADPEEAAKRLTTEAYEKGSLDNITCIVVRFLRNTQDGLLQGAANGLGKLKIED